MALGPRNVRAVLPYHILRAQCTAMIIVIIIFFKVKCAHDWYAGCNYRWFEHCWFGCVFWVRMDPYCHHIERPTAFAHQWCLWNRTKMSKTDCFWFIILRDAICNAFNIYNVDEYILIGREAISKWYLCIRQRSPRNRYTNKAKFLFTSIWRVFWNYKLLWTICRTNIIAYVDIVYIISDLEISSYKDARRVWSLLINGAYTYCCYWFLFKK